MTISIVLPFPISVNAMYKNAGRRRAVSQRYRDWKTAAGWALNKQYLGTPMTEPIMLQIALRQPDNRRRDLDNCAKGIQDLLTGKVISDDSQIKLLFLWWEDNIKGGEARVMIDPITSNLAQSFLRSFDDNALKNKPNMVNELSDGTATDNSRPSVIRPKQEAKQQ